MIPKLWKWPLWVWAAVVLPRAILLMLAAGHPQACLPPDAENYLILALNLASFHMFTHVGAPAFTPEIFRLPGYPLFLSIFSAAPSPVLWAAFAQSLLGALTALIFGAWLREWLNEKAARVGVLILALDAVVLLHTPMLLAETLVLFLSVIALYQTWRALAHSQVRTTVIGGLLWGSALMVKPVFLYFPMLVSVLWRKQKRYAGIFLLAAYLLPVGWIIRNGLQADFWGLTTQSGLALLLYPAAGIEAMRTGQPVEQLQKDLKDRVDAGHPAESRESAAHSQAYTAAAKEIIRPHPFLLIRYCLVGVVRILAGTGASLWLTYFPSMPVPPGGWTLGVIGLHTWALFRAHPWLLPIQLLYALALAALYISAVWGWYQLRRKGYSREAYLIAAGTLYLLAVASHQGYSRFRIPMMPFLAAGAAAVFLKK